MSTAEVYAEELPLRPDLRAVEAETAPENGAVFYLEHIRARREREQRDIAKPPIVRGRHERPVPTLDSGLVDLDALALYMHPNPLYVPLYRTPGWKYHHLNHPESSFKQWSTDLEERDARLVILRNSSYQQVHMRVTSEAIYHNVHELYVPRPVSESVDAILRDFEKLDMLGAACLYLNLVKGCSEYRVDAGSLSPPWMEEVTLKERVGFMEEVRADMAQVLVEAEIIPQRLVTSALKRVSMHLRDPYMGHLADQRLASDPVFYPVRVPSQQTLLIQANKLMATELLSSERALQTGVDTVESGE